MPHDPNVVEREKLITQLFDAATVRYLRHKHQGGANGEKGTRYEDFFAVVKIAEIARDQMQGCQRITAQAQAPFFFVDDLVVTDGASSHQTCHQLKNSDAVAWSAGEHPIALDFTRQRELSRAVGLSATPLVLVLSDKTRAEKLQLSTPTDLQPFTTVRWFPWEANGLRFCEHWPEHVEALAWLSKHDNPDFNQVWEVLTVLVGSWAVFDGAVSVRTVIDHARSCSPMMIRPLITDDDAASTLRTDVVEILARISYFSYSMNKGFFTWAFCPPNGTETRGVYSHDCCAAQFANLQARVVKRMPVSFDEIEEEL